MGKSKSKKKNSRQNKASVKTTANNTASKRLQKGFWEWKYEGDVTNFSQQAFRNGIEFFPVRIRPKGGDFQGDFRLGTALEQLFEYSKKGFDHYERFRDGSYLFNCTHVEGVKAFLRLSKLLNHPVTCEVEWLRVGRRYILSGIDPDTYLADDLAKELTKQGLPVVHIKKLHMNKGKNNKIPLPYVYIDIFGRELISSATVWNKSYYLAPNEEQFNQCNKCYRFGHIARFCKGPKRCVRCSQYLDDVDVIDHKCLITICLNCFEGHPATDIDCKALKKELGVVKLMNEFGISRPKASGIYRDKERQLEKESLTNLLSDSDSDSEEDFYCDDSESDEMDSCLGAEAAANVKFPDCFYCISQKTFNNYIPKLEEADDEFNKLFEVPVVEVLAKEGYWHWKAQENIQSLVRHVLHKFYTVIPVRMRPLSGSFPDVNQKTLYELSQKITVDFEFYEILHDGSFLFFCSSEAGVMAFLKCDKILDIPATCEVAWYPLVSRRHVLHNLNPNCTAQTIGNYLNKKGLPVVQVRRLPSKENKNTPIKSIFIDVIGEDCIPEVRLGLITYYLKDFETNVVQCTKCYRFGHQSKTCNGETKCPKCGKILPKDSSHKCTTLKCINCGANHSSTDLECVTYLKEQYVLSIITEHYVNRREALKISEIMESVQKSFSEAQKVDASTQAEEPSVNNVAALLAQIQEFFAQEPTFNEVQNIVANIARMAHLLSQQIRNSRGNTAFRGG